MRVLACHQLVFEVTAVLSAGGKHTVRTTQLLINKKNAGTRQQEHELHPGKTEPQITAVEA